MEKTKKDTFGLVKTVLFFLLVGVLLFYILIQLFLPNQTIKIFGFKPYSVLTQSMEPEINVGDLVFVKEANLAELKVEDIITFNADINYDGEKEIVTHYIYSIEENAQGDTIFRTHPYFENSSDIQPDPWIIAEQDVIGEYNFHIPWIGTVILFLQSPFGIAAMLVNTGVIVAVVVLIKQDKKEDKEDSESLEE